MKVLLFAVLFISLTVISNASSTERDEYFFGDSADATVDFDERDTNTTVVVVPVSNGTLSYNVSTSSGDGELKVKIPFTIDGAYATLEEATVDNPEYQDPSQGTRPGTYLGTSFFLTITKGGSEIHDTFPEPIQVSVTSTLFNANSDLYLYNTTSLEWVSASSTCPTASQMKTFVNGTLTVNICHLTQFAIFSVTADVTTTGGSPVLKASSGKSNTTLIVAIVVPIGSVILIVAAIVAYVIVSKQKKGLYDVEMANHKQNVVINSGTKTPQDNRVSEFTRSSVQPKQDEASSSDDEESESELEERKQASESEEESSDEESSSQAESSETSSQDSDDSDSTNETNSDDSDE